MERGIKMTVTMEFTELIFKDDSKLLVRYDAGTNVPLLYGYHNDYVAEFFGRLYKCVTDPIFLNLGHQDKHLMWWYYNLGRIGYHWFLHLERWDIIQYKLSTIDVSELKCASHQFKNMTLKSTGNQ